MRWEHDDGGYVASGLKHNCVCVAIAIAGQLDYRRVYNTVTAEASQSKLVRHRVRPEKGVYKPARDRSIARLLPDWVWTPTMFIGSGCKVHLLDGELPMGRLIVKVSKHLVAVIDGVIHDTHDPSRYGSRCVYGYWRKA